MNGQVHQLMGLVNEVPLNPILTANGRNSLFQTKELSVSLKCNLPENNVRKNTLK